MITGVLLAVARISGETAPLLFTALNNQFWSLDMNAPVASLPVVIFQFALSPYKDWQQLAWTGALIITLAVLALSITARTPLGTEEIVMSMTAVPDADADRSARCRPAPKACPRRSRVATSTSSTATTAR